MIKERKKKLEETIRSEIKDLCQAYGYEEYKMRMFEKYSLYLEHKDFLVSEKVITFTDLNGELLALRPDVTLSIVKNAKAEAGCTEKMYYCENVYRVDKQNRRFREINQLGVELIGEVGDVEIAEIFSLALGALGAIGSDFVLEFSHLDFVSALMDLCKLDEAASKAFRSALGRGNEDELRFICALNGVSADLTARVCGLVRAGGELQRAIPAAEALVASGEMAAALDEIKRLQSALEGEENINKLRLDFSLTGEENYYNGFIIRGFVQGVPKAVLSGGQYDKLLKMMDKNASALGFAVYLGEISNVKPYEAETDVGVIYGKKSALEAMNLARELRNNGKSVRLLRSKNQQINCKTYIDMGKIK